MAYDPWLDRWIPELLRRSADKPVLEVGCGSGDDTVTLLRSGLQVIAFDISPKAVDKAKLAAPAASVFVQDVLSFPFPLEGSQLNVIIASLSLHYFGWPQTVSLVARIHDALVPGGLLLCRVNSTEDTHFGSVGHPEIEPGLFMVNGKPKRFFNREAIGSLIGKGWHLLSLEHRLTYKYEHPKRLWEVVAQTEP